MISIKFWSRKSIPHAVFLMVLLILQERRQLRFWFMRDATHTEHVADRFLQELLTPKAFPKGNKIISALS